MSSVQPRSLSTFERTVYGTSGPDLMLGDARNEIFRGSWGADTVDGGEGYDVIDYGQSPQPVIIDFSYQNGAAREGTLPATS